MTPAQQRMVLERPELAQGSSGEPLVDREDDWSQFGLYRVGNNLRAPDDDPEALDRYVEWKRRQKAEAEGKS